MIESGLAGTGAPGPEVAPLQAFTSGVEYAGQKLDAILIPGSLPNTFTRTIKGTHSRSTLGGPWPPGLSPLCRALPFYGASLSVRSGAELGCRASDSVSFCKVCCPVDGGTSVSWWIMLSRALWVLRKPVSLGWDSRPCPLRSEATS